MLSLSSSSHFSSRDSTAAPSTVSAMVSSPAVGPPSSCDSRLSSHSSHWRRLTVAESVGIRDGWVFPGSASLVACVRRSARSSLSSPCPFSCGSQPISHSSRRR
eukprot:6791143-Pyramimonas_sp.AAC.2